MPKPVTPAAAMPADAAPVRPRRVTAGSLALSDDETAPDDGDNIFGPDSRFAAFAASVKAEELHEVMEAAAAWLTVVEGRDSFTRPMLVGLLSAQGDRWGDLARETGLRAFGQLLRDGRIRKSRRGQFDLNPASPMLAEARKARG
jgi:hypothetical protein